MKKILLSLDSLGIGGVETSCLTQTKEFSKRGYEIYILSKKGIFQSEFEKIKNVHIINMDYEPQNGIQEEKVNFVRKVLKENNIDIVYIHKLEGILSVFTACILDQIPYIAYVHMRFVKDYEWYMGYLNISKNILKLFYQKAYKIVAISQKAKDDNQKLFGINDDEYKIVPNAIFFEGNEKPTKEKPKNILIVSRLDEDKGKGVYNGIEFAKAYANLIGNSAENNTEHKIEHKKEHKIENKVENKINLTIIGDGKDRKKFEENVEKEISKNEKLNKLIDVSFLGAKNNVTDYIKQNDIIIGVDRVLQEAISQKKIALIAGYNNFKGMILPENIEEVSKVNFSGENMQDEKPMEIGEKILKLKNQEILEIVNLNYKWLYENRNVEDNIYDVEIPSKDIDKNEIYVKEASPDKEGLNHEKDMEDIILGLSEELGYIQQKYNNDWKNVWEIKENTEEYYQKREEWNQNQLKIKDEKIKKLKQELMEHEKYEKLGALDKLKIKFKNIKNNK